MHPPLTSSPTDSTPARPTMYLPGQQESLGVKWMTTQQQGIHSHQTQLPPSLPSTQASLQMQPHQRSPTFQSRTQQLLPLQQQTLQSQAEPPWDHCQDC